MDSIKLMQVNDNGKVRYAVPIPELLKLYEAIMTETANEKIAVMTFKEQLTIEDKEDIHYANGKIEVIEKIRHKTSQLLDPIIQIQRQQ